MNDGQNFFDQSARNNLIIYDSIRKITTGQGDDYTNGCCWTNIISKTIIR